MSQAKCVGIRLDYADGSYHEAVDADHAEAILKWWQSCECLAFVHGGRADFEPLRLVTPHPTAADLDAVAEEQKVRDATKQSWQEP